ncbi:MAG: hypothetical protein HY320_02495 [Armatimonadetes bacterium]|nr:hypothetical protein [Armatimonadota bacterium]
MIRRAIFAVLLLLAMAGASVAGASPPEVTPFEVLVPAVYLNLDDTHLLEVRSRVDPARVSEVRLMVRGEPPQRRAGGDPEWRRAEGWAIPLPLVRRRTEFRVELVLDGRTYAHPARGWAIVRARPRWLSWVYLFAGWLFCLLGLPPLGYASTRFLNRRARPDHTLKLSITAGIGAAYLWFAWLFGYSGFAGTGSDVPFVAGGLAVIVISILVLFR